MLVSDHLRRTSDIVQSKRWLDFHVASNARVLAKAKCKATESTGRVKGSVHLPLLLQGWIEDVP